MPATDIAKRNAASRRRGASWEVEAVDGFMDAGLRTMRTRNSGEKDQGDLAIFVNGHDYVIEAKNKARFEPQAWVREAIVEAKNYAEKNRLGVESVHPAVCMKVRGRGFGGSIVLLPVDEYVRLIKAASDVIHY